MRKIGIVYVEVRFNVSPYTSITVGAKRPFSSYGIYVCSATLAAVSPS